MRYRVLKHYSRFLAILLLITSPLCANETLDWEQAVKETLQHNPELRGAQERIQATEAVIRQAESSFFPQINSSVGYSYGRVSNPNPIATTNAGDNYTASLSLAYPIFQGFRNQADVTQAKLRKHLASLEEAELRSRLNFELKSAFSSLIYAQEAFNLQNEIMKRRTENFNLVVLRYEGGLENKGSVMLSEAYLKEAEFAQLQASQRIQVAQAQLNRILGRNDRSNFIGVGQVPTHPPPKQPDYQTLITRSLEFQQVETQTLLAKSSITTAKSGFFPTMSLSGDMSRRGDDWFPDTKVWSVGVAVNYPLFTGGRDKASLEQARASHNEALTNRENLDRDLLARLQQAYTNLVAAEEQLNVTSRFREAAQVRADVARTKYNNGLISFEEWDRIETDLILREQNYLINLRDRVTAEAAWEQVQGIGVLQ
ncbi:MAG: TolC family protein [Oligoflexus sp.]